MRTPAAALRSETLVHPPARTDACAAYRTTSADDVGGGNGVGVGAGVGVGVGLGVGVDVGVAVGVGVGVGIGVGVGVGAVPDAVKRHTEPLAVWFAIVLPTMRQ